MFLKHLLLRNSVQIILATFLTFICPCITNIFLSYNQQDATFLDYLFIYLFISTDALHAFMRFLHPSSGAQHCTIQPSGIVNQYCC